MNKEKRRFGDRRDGRLLRDIDSMHFIMPVIYPNRCDNEAYISERIDLTAADKWLEKMNEGETEFPYKIFHLIVAALLKTVTLRPKMNRFIANCNMYEHNDISAAFIVKKQFSDNGGEGMVILRAEDGESVITVHDKIKNEVTACRNNRADSTEDAMDMFQKLPRFISKAGIRFVAFLEQYGKAPKSMIASDPYYSSMVISNLGSLKMKCGYHHLVNWGTTSLFCIIGEMKMTPFFDAEGKVTMKKTVDLGLTIDERIADGYYYAKTIRLLKTLLENPSLLEKQFTEEVDY